MCEKHVVISPQETHVQELESSARGNVFGILLALVFYGYINIMVMAN